MLKYSVSTYSKILEKKIGGTACIFQFQQQNARNALCLFHYLRLIILFQCFGHVASPFHLPRSLAPTQKVIAFDCFYWRKLSVQERANPVMAQIAYSL